MEFYTNQETIPLFIYGINAQAVIFQPGAVIYNSEGVITGFIYHIPNKIFRLYTLEEKPKEVPRIIENLDRFSGEGINVITGYKAIKAAKGSKSIAEAIGKVAGIYGGKLVVDLIRSALFKEIKRQWIKNMPTKYHYVDIVSKNALPIRPMTTIEHL